MKNNEIDEETVKILAKVANLPIAADRERLIASQLNEWIINANKLSDKMSDSKYESLMPVAVFSSKPIK